MTDETRGGPAPATMPRDTWFWRPLLALCVLAVAAVFSGQRVFVQVSWLSTALNFYGVLAYAATSVLLLSTLRVDARRSIVVLAATAAGMAALAGLTTISVPMAPALPSVLTAGPQSGPWLYVFQYLTATAGALIYALYRRDDTARAPSGRTVVAYVGGTVAVIGAIALAALILAGVLPVLTVAGGFTGLRSSGLFYAHGVLAAVAILALGRLRDRDDIDRAVLLSVIAIVLIDVVLIFHVHRYTAGYLIVRILSGASATFVLLAAMRRVVKAYEQLPIVRATLDRTERLAVRQSDRLTAVWRLVSDADIDEELRLQAILDAGASALRPGHAFFGTLRRVEGDEDLVVELVSEAFKTGPEQSRRFARNDRIKLETVFAADIIAAGKTVAFSDYGNDIGPDLRQKRYNSSNWNSAIGTSFVVANTRYVLSFAAFEKMGDEPFSDDDLAFIDVLASFIASRLHHGRQLAQIRYQIDHDALTGLPTRSSFRAAAAQLISAGIPCAIAVIDLDRFREVNETFGHMLGDAMLVEIAAGLTGARRWTSKPACNRTAASSNGRCSPATAPAAKRSSSARAPASRSFRKMRRPLPTYSPAPTRPSMSRKTVSAVRSRFTIRRAKPQSSAASSRARSTTASSNCTTCPRSNSRGAPWRASRDSCAGNIRSSAPSARTSSSRWQSTTR